MPYGLYFKQKNLENEIPYDKYGHYDAIKESKIKEKKLRRIEKKVKKGEILADSEKRYYLSFLSVDNSDIPDFNENIMYNSLNSKEILSNFCEDLTARKFSYNPSIGREKELEKLMIALVTPKKSAMIIGKPGTGKTSLVEGLAYNIQNKNVPASLRKYTILQTSASILNSNCIYNGMLEKRVLDLFNLVSKMPNTILFFDEIHTLIGTGNSDKKSLDIANIIKPYLQKDSISLIGATTTDEYDEFINMDPAFRRRFLTIELKEPDNSTLVKILAYTIKAYSKEYKVEIDKSIDIVELSKILVNNTIKKRRNQYEYLYNPDLAISIVSSAFGYARLYNNSKLSICDIKRAYANSNAVIGKLEYSQNKHSSNNIISLNSYLKKA